MRQKQRGPVRALRATARIAPTAETRSFSKDGGRGKPLPYERNTWFQVCAEEPLRAPAEIWAAFQEPTLIRHGFAVPPSPLEGEGYLYRERWLRKLRRKSGTAPSEIFANPGPSGPEGTAPKHS